MCCGSSHHIPGSLESAPVCPVRWSWHERTWWWSNSPSCSIPTPEKWSKMHFVMIWLAASQPSKDRSSNQIRDNFINGTTTRVSNNFLLYCGILAWKLAIKEHNCNQWHSDLNSHHNSQKATTSIVGVLSPPEPQLQSSHIHINYFLPLWMFSLGTFK